jgi:hypothetical protein
VTITGARLGPAVEIYVLSEGNRVLGETLGTAVGVSFVSEGNRVLGKAAGTGGSDGVGEGPSVGLTLASGMNPGVLVASGRAMGAKEGGGVALGEGLTGDCVSCEFARLLLLGLSSPLFHKRLAVTAMVATAHTGTVTMTVPRFFMLRFGVFDPVVVRSLQLALSSRRAFLENEEAPLVERSSRMRKLLIPFTVDARLSFVRQEKLPEQADGLSLVALPFLLLLFFRCCDVTLLLTHCSIFVLRTVRRSRVPPRSPFLQTPSSSKTSTNNASAHCKLQGEQPKTSSSVAFTGTNKDHVEQRRGRHYHC